MKQSYSVEAGITADLTNPDDLAWLALRLEDGMNHAIPHRDIEVKRITVIKTADKEERDKAVAKHIARVVLQSRNFIETVESEVYDDVRQIKESYDSLMKAGKRFGEAWEEAHENWIKNYLANNS